MSNGIGRREMSFYVFSFEFVNTIDTDFRFPDDNASNTQILHNWKLFWEKYGRAIVESEWCITYHGYLLSDNSNIVSVENNIPNQAEEENTLAEVLNGNGSPQNESEFEAAVDYTEDWNTLWHKFTQQLHDDNYLKFNEIYNDRVCQLWEYVQQECVIENNGKLEKDDVYTICAENELLSQLGLPRAFGSGNQKTQSTRKRLTRSLLLPCDKTDTDSTDGLDCSSIDLESETDEKEEEEDEEDSSSDMNSLNDVQAKQIAKKKKKKNRKLRHLPAFMRDERGMLKYWKRRFSLFSRFDEGIQLDREGWFSVTPEKVAVHMAERLACDVLIDGFCGCGGNAIHFAKTCRQVIAIDIDADKLAMARHNAQIYGVAHKIEFILGDFFHLSNNQRLYGNIVFLSPPWGGPNYKKRKHYDIEEQLSPICATDLMKAARNISPNVALFLPRNAKIDQIIKLAGIGERCEVEHNYLDTRLVGLTALYGETILPTKEEI